MSTKSQTITVGQTITLQKCKHSWLNGEKAVVTKVHSDNDFTVESSLPYSHRISLKNIK